MPQYVDTSFIYSCLTILQKKENVGGKTCKPLTSYIDVHLPSSFTYATKRTQDSPKKMRTVLSFFIWESTIGFRQHVFPCPKA